MLRQAVGDLNRLRQILQVLVKHGFGDLLERARIFERLRIKRPAAPAAAGERSPAERLARMLAELGPTFVKMGQLLSTRPDLLPVEYIQALSKLQDRAPPFSFEQVRRIIERDLGAPLAHSFARLEREPLASASIAQVHEAETLDGRAVVVKVRRPGIEETVRSSLDVLYTLAHLLETVVSESQLFEPAQIVREFDRAMALEMDLKQEARNLELFARNFSERSTMTCPQTLPQLCGPNVLTMTRLTGRHISEFSANSAEARAAALNLIEGFYQQAFEDGFFHADPHPGNMLILEDGRVGLLDFGQVGRLSPGQRSTMVLLGLGIILKDADTVARLVYRVGAKGERVDLAEFRREVQGALEQSLEKRLGEIDSQALLQRLIVLALHHRVRVPPEFTLAVKALVTVESSVRRLAPELEPGTVAAPYIKRLLAEHYGLGDLSGGLGRLALQLTSLAGEMPRQLSQILLDLECGRFNVQVEDRQAAHTHRVLRALGMDIFWGLVATGLLAGSLPALVGSGPASAGAWLALGGAGLIAVTVTARYFLSPLWQRMGLRRWLERDWRHPDSSCREE